MDLRRIAFVLQALLWWSLACPKACAVPVWGEVFDLRQPDGSLVKARVWGDEFYQRVESLDGYTLVRDPNTGFIAYADLAQEGEDLTSTAEVYRGVNRDAIPQANRRPLRKGLRIRPEAARRKAALRRRVLLPDSGVSKAGRGTQPAALGPDLAPDTTPTVVLGLTILIQFPDKAGTIPRQEVEDLLNRSRYAGNGNKGSVRDYFLDVSGGLLDYSNQVTDYYMAKNPKDYYNDPSAEGRVQELLLEALNDLESKGFDFSVLSTDSVAMVRAVNFFYAGSPDVGWAEGLWPHSGSISAFNADGVKIRKYQISSMGTKLTIGTFCHENGHMVCAWPDLYDYDHDSHGAGGYCLMAGGASSTNPMPPNPYYRYLQGWETMIDITHDLPGTVRTCQANSLVTYYYPHPVNTDEMFLIESRVKKGRNAQCPDEGLIVWHADQQGDNDWQEMTVARHYRVSVIQADGYFQLEKSSDSGGNGGGAGDLFHAGGVDRLDDRTLPGTQWWNGDDSGLVLRDISESGDTMTFSVGNGQAPLARWRLDGDTQDDVGQGRPAQVLGTDLASWVPDHPTGKGQSLGFDGIDDALVCGCVPGLGQTVTWTAWIKTGAETDQVVANKGTTWQLLLGRDGSLVLHWDDTDLASPPGLVQAGQWTHLACAFGSNSAALYLNGRTVTRRTQIQAPAPDPSSCFILGRGGIPGLDTPFKGLMADVQIFDESLDEPALAEIVARGLWARRMVAHWPLDETSGKVASDLSGHGYAASLKKGLSFGVNHVPGRIDGALSFDGINDYGSCSGLFLGHPEATICAWIWTNGILNNRPGIVFSRAQGTVAGLSLTGERGTQRLGYLWADQHGNVATPLTVPGNQWIFVALAVRPFDATLTTFDGKAWMTFTNTAGHSFQRFAGETCIGRDPLQDQQRYFKGRIDDVRVYDYALTGSELLDVALGARAACPTPRQRDWFVAPGTPLEWSPTSYATQYDVYFGQDLLPVMIATPGSSTYAGRLTETRFNPVLRSGADYFWRVDEVGPEGRVLRGDVWTFRAKGAIHRQVWTGIDGTALTGLTQDPCFPSRPNVTEVLYRLETPQNWGSDYGDRIHGYLMPRSSGTYTFWIAGDDTCEFWLSPDEDPDHRQLAAKVSSATSPRAWDARTEQRSAPILLKADQPYYIMVLHKEGSGSDHLSVAWQGPDSPQRAVIDGEFLIPWPSTATPASTRAAP